MRTQLAGGIILVALSATAVGVQAGQAQVATTRHGTATAAIAGGALGAFSGTVIGGGLLRRLCQDRGQVCWPPLMADLLAGTTAGAYAGATDTRRVRGATIGLGAGFLGGLVITSLLISSDAIKPDGEWQPLADVIAGGLIGAALGSVVGGLLSSSEDPGENHAAIRLVQVSF